MEGRTTDAASSSGIPVPSTDETLLVLAALRTRYASGTPVLRDVDMHVNRGEIVALLGANGAGKTTLLRAITGLLGIHRGRIIGGSIAFAGRRIDRWDPAAIVRAGISQVMEGRRIFGELTVEENLRVGGFVRRDGAVYRTNLDRVFSMFPILAERRNNPAGFLSGGEQQMLAIGRALMSEPELLLLDEPSLGVAPMIVERVRDAILAINRDGATILLIEQNAAMALAMANRAYVLERGAVVMSGPAGEIAADDRIREFYLGISESVA